MDIKYQTIQAILTKRRLLIPLDVLVVGATGTGKSSTINAIFGKPLAKVGDGVDPQTQKVSAYKPHEYFRIHDSAGLGDGLTADISHEKNIAHTLNKECYVDGKKYGYIDLVLVILDGGSRDLGTAFNLLETVVLQSIASNRVIVAINQADMAMKGRNWNTETHQPDAILLNFLEEQAGSVQKRIKESTGLNIQKPVYYSALNQYNLDALMDHIIAHLPEIKRSVGDGKSVKST
jgi:uncharacterized protein